MANDPYTVSLLHFNGADESTTFTDESGKSWSPQTNTKLTTAQKKFGTASGNFIGTGGIATAPHADFTFGNGDFTIDFWVKISTSTGDMILCIRALNGYNYAPFCIFRPTGAFALTFNSSSNGTSWNLCNGVAIGTLTSGAWAHVAICRSGTNIYCFLNGVLGSTTNVGTASLVAATSRYIWLGSDGTYCHSTSNMDEVRFSKGVARWTSDFSASLPDAEYSISLDSSIALPLLQLAI